MDYFDYFQYLMIVWKRITEEYTTSLDYHLQQSDLLSTKQGKSHEYHLIYKKSKEISIILQCDIETFMMFVRRFLDKLAKLVEELITLPKGIHVENSFTGHRKFFIEHSHLHPTYSSLLQDETNWYEQELLLWRDKILTHGKTLNTTYLISPTRGIQFIKSIGVHEIREKDRISFYKIKEKYEQMFPELKNY